MLTILGRPQRHPFCDGLKRRDFLKIGGLAMGGLSLPPVAAGRGGRRHSRLAQSRDHDLPAGRPAAPGFS